MAEAYRLRVLGERDLTGADGRRIASVLAQPKRFGLLAYLATARAPVSRASLAALFWPESDESRARNALSQSIFYLRKSLGRDVIETLAADDVRLAPGRVSCDLAELLYAEQPDADVVAAAAGPVMGGWNADDSQPLQEWLDGMRRAATARRAELVQHDPELPTAEPNDSSRGPTSSADRATDRRIAWTVAAVAVVVLLFIAIGRPPQAATPVEAPDPPPTLVVLNPVVVSATDAPALTADQVGLEVLAEVSDHFAANPVNMLHADGIRDAWRTLDAFRDPTVPDLVDPYLLVITAAVGTDELRLSSGLHTRERAIALVTRTLDFDDAEDLALNAARRIAELVVESAALELPAISAN